MAIQTEATPGGGGEADPIAVLIGEGRFRDALVHCTRTHAGSMGRLCMALLGDAAEAEEVLQESLVAAYHAMSGYRGEGSVRAWLHGIARRQCARRLTMRVRRERRLRLVHDASAPGAPLPDEELERRRRGERVREALEELKPSDREALLLRYETGLSFAEIASLQSIDEVAARKRASRALARLRTLLTEVDR
ncbi:MAG: RNA polymerase sigma factor [Myxococcales bacterium]|nr:RNA polymerase sigma factor [Myxococcales bacterium]